MRKALIAGAIALLCAARFLLAAAGAEGLALPFDETGRGGWARDTLLDEPAAPSKKAGGPAAASGALAPPRVVKGQDGRNELVFEAGFPAPAGVIRNVGADREAWGRGRAVRARVYVPSEAGPHPTVQLIAYHSVWGWFATLPTRELTPGAWTNVYWPLSGETADWKSMEGSIAWNDTMRCLLSRVGLRVFSEACARVEIHVSDVVITGLDDPPPALSILNVLVPETAQRGKRFELTFDLSRWYDNPFDPDAASADVDFIDPSARKMTVPAFYYQDFTRRRLSDGTEACDPVGRACWKARYTPLEAGTHSFTIRVRDRFGDTTQTLPITFSVADVPFRGFLRVDARDPFFLSFTQDPIRASPSNDDTFFYLIGLIVRSPDDERRQYDYEFEMHPGMGTFAYDDYFTSMAAAGLNFTRVWMSAWWTALEWSHGYRTDYPGIGQYNLLNAWRMDYLMTLAENLGIYVDVTLHNHGQFRARTFDDEWYDNAYYKGNGGPIDRPEEFWMNEKARDYMRKRLRYIAARWGYSPAVAWWELCNEVDLVGSYDSFRISSWHRVMAQYLKQIDPYNHIVTTHYTANRLDENVQAMPEIEVCQSTAYFPDMVNRVKSMYLDHRVFSKPVYLNEFGVGNSHHELRYNLHAGLWASSVTPLCGAALFWWWPYIQEKNEYPQYEAIVRFHKGEDYRNRDFQIVDVTTQDKLKVVEAMGMQNTTAARLWIYDNRLYRAATRGREPAPVDESRFQLEGLEPGRYKIEFWDTWKGEPFLTKDIECGGGTLTVETPPFERDIACKIERQEAPPQ